jgi:hypothetical protein
MAWQTFSDTLIMLSKKTKQTLIMILINCLDLVKGTGDERTMGARTGNDEGRGFIYPTAQGIKKADKNAPAFLSAFPFPPLIVMVIFCGKSPFLKAPAV